MGVILTNGILAVVVDCRWSLVRFGRRAQTLSFFDVRAPRLQLQRECPTPWWGPAMPASHAAWARAASRSAMMCPTWRQYIRALLLALARYHAAVRRTRSSKTVDVQVALCLGGDGFEAPMMWRRLSHRAAALLRCQVKGRPAVVFALVYP